MKRLAAILAATGAVFLLTFSLTASAQETDQGAEQGMETEQEQEGAGDEARPQGKVVTETVTVTARKREEQLQEVPFSIAAATEEILRDRSVQNLEDISANIAGFSVQNLGPGQSQVAIRGVSAGQIVRDQPGVKEQVGVYLDESVISLSLFTPDIDLFDMNRIEVLRGPQGTLFGSGSLSGTVRYITNQPKLGVQEAYAEVSGSFIDGGDVGGTTKVAVNVPLGSSAATRIAAYYVNTGGFMDAIQPGLNVNSDVDRGDRTGVRWTTQIVPSSSLTITPRILYQEEEREGWNRQDEYNILANPFTTTRPAVDLGEREQFTQLEEQFDDDFLLVDLDVDYVFGNLLFESVTSFIDRDILVVRDATALTASITGGTIGLPEPVFTIDAPLDDATTFESLTQEVRLSGFQDRLTWVAGAFYSTSERDYGQDLLVDGFEDATGIPTAGFRAPKDVLFFSDLDYDFEQLAVFGEVTYEVNDRLNLTGGLRFYDFEEDRIQTFDGIFAAPGTTEGSTTADGIAPRLIASFELNPNWQLNAQVSKGFRLGGINDPLNVPLCTPQDLETFGGNDTWDDEVLWNYEIGAKGNVMEGRGLFNVAAFFTDISDLQATVTAGSCSSRVVFNVPEAESRGLELEYSARVNEAFDFAISASFIDSELQSTLTSTDAQGNVSIVSGIQDGNRLPTVPELQMAAAAGYRWDMSRGWGGYASGTFQHVGSRFTQIGDQAAGFGTVNLLAFAPNTIGGPLTQSTFTFDPELPSYDIVNLRIGFANDRWDASLFINNVTDELALLSLDQERGTLARVGFQVNQPRTIGVSTRVNF